MRSQPPSFISWLRRPLSARWLWLIALILFITSMLDHGTVGP